MGTSTTYDIAVIGGGAAGLAAAITAARTGASTLIIEKDVACGLPILATGNGRCNLSNAHLDSIHYRHPEIARTVMGEHPEDGLSAFFESIGIELTAENDRLYPRSKRAESVRDALVGAANRADVKAMLGSHVIAAEFSATHWRLTVETPKQPLPATQPPDKTDLRRRRKALSAAPLQHQVVTAKRCILAVGGKSEETAQIFNLNHLPEQPVLCPLAGGLELSEQALKELDGLRIDAGLTLLHNNSPVWEEFGEALFRSYGISGIAAFNMSRRAYPGDIIELNLFADMSEEALLTKLKKRQELLAPITPANPHWFDGLFAPQLARLIAPTYHGNLTALAHLVQHLHFQVSEPTELKSAQVRQGGIPFDAVDLETLEVKSKQHLYVCGEALDMDADCGGFNLAWAWTSGICAGMAAVAL